jgi:DNA-binding HxlR family transcriptional regulator
MRQTSFADFHCSLAQSLEVVGDWWTPLIVRDISLGLTRFDQLAEDLGISRNLLTTRLQALEDHGVVERRQYRERPPRYEYRLTRAGVELVPILMSLTAWGDRWCKPPGGGGVRFRHRTCGHSFIPTVSCSACGAPVRAADVIPRPGPGSVDAPGTRLLPEQLRRLATAAGAADGGEER